MIDCRNGEIRDQLPDFVHDQLNPSARAEVAKHVATCSACAAELALLRELRGTLRSGPSVDVARIVAALPVPGARSRFRRPARRAVDWRVAAAIVALAVGAGSVTVLRVRQRDSVPVSSPPVAQRSPREVPAVQRLATADLSIDADLGDVSVAELEALLEELDTFDGLPAGEPELPPTSSGGGEEGL